MPGRSMRLWASRLTACSTSSGVLMRSRAASSSMVSRFPWPRSASKRPFRARSATSSASARTTTSMRMEFTRSGFEAGAKVEDAIPKAPIIFTKAPETVIADGDRHPLSARRQRQHRLRGRARRRHRQGRPRHQQGGRLRPRLGLHDHQRRDGARPAEPSTSSGSSASRSTPSARWGRGW